MTSALTRNGVQTVRLKNTILSPACQAGGMAGKLSTLLEVRFRKGEKGRTAFLLFPTGRGEVEANKSS